MDVTVPESVQAAVEVVERSCGGLDGLVNCAGVFVGGPLTEIAEEEVRRALEVNVLGVEAFSDALRRELMLLGMPVVVIQPGPVRTSLLEVPPATFGRCAEESSFASSLRKAQRWAAGEWQKACAPIEVARAVCRALHTDGRRPRYRVHNNVGRAFLEVLPAEWVDALMRRVM